MWAHYANSHKGVCVGFHTKALTETKVGEFMLGHAPVRYGTTPHLAVVSDPNNMNEIYLHAGEVLLTKSIDWAYEKEHRFSVDNPSIANDGGGIINVGADAVYDVIFGARADEKDIEEFRMKIPQKALVHQAEINSRAYTYNMHLRRLNDKSDNR